MAAHGSAWRHLVVHKMTAMLTCGSYCQAAMLQLSCSVSLAQPTLVCCWSQGTIHGALTEATEYTADAVSLLERIDSLPIAGLAGLKRPAAPSAAFALLTLRCLCCDSYLFCCCV
jgi:hypothetical protein